LLLLKTFFSEPYFNPPMKRKIILFLIFFVANIPFSQAANDKQLLVDRVLAVVNDQVITQSEFEVVYRPIYEQMRQAAQGPELAKELERVRIQLLNQMIEDKLVYMESQKMGIEVTDVEVQEEIDSFINQYPDKKEFEKQLAMDGITMTDLKKRFKERVAIQKLHEGFIRSQIAVTPQAVEEAYQKHQDEFNDKEKVEVWVLTINKNPGAIQSGTMDEVAKSKTMRMMQDLKAGTNFSSLAKQYSEDAHAEKEGYLGFVEKGSFVGKLDEVLFSLPQDSISDVLETENGYHIFKIGIKVPPRKKTFDEVKSEIRNQLYREKAHEKFVEWMTELKKKSYISIK